jgi:hypothetical protein
VKTIVDIHQSLAERKGDRISGVESNNLPERCLTERENSRHNLIDSSPATLEKSAKEVLGHGLLKLLILS